MSMTAIQNPMKSDAPSYTETSLANPQGILRAYLKIPPDNVGRL